MDTSKIRIHPVWRPATVEPKAAGTYQALLENGTFKDLDWSKETGWTCNGRKEICHSWLETVSAEEMQDG